MEQNNSSNNENSLNKESKENIAKECEIISTETAAYDYNYKLIVIGDSGVGKTCLTYRVTTGEFKDRLGPTTGFEYFPFIVKYKNKILKLEIWDTCGQETYRSLIKTFFNNSSLAIIVYAIDNRKSFDSIEEWIRQCRSLCSPNTKFFLIGNKSDVDDEQ
jgi:small GTP-binding protein